MGLQYQRKGLGELLLVDALSRAQRIHAVADGVGLFVDAIDPSAAAFYPRFGFETSPDNQLLLFLCTKAMGSQNYFTASHTSLTPVKNMPA